MTASLARGKPGCWWPRRWPWWRRARQGLGVLERRDDSIWQERWLLTAGLARVEPGCWGKRAVKERSAGGAVEYPKVSVRPGR